MISIFMAFAQELIKLENLKSNSLEVEMNEWGRDFKMCPPFDSSFILNQHGHVWFRKANYFSTVVIVWFVFVEQYLYTGSIWAFFQSSLNTWREKECKRYRWTSKKGVPLHVPCVNGGFTGVHCTKVICGEAPPSHDLLKTVKRPQNLHR